MSVDFGEFMRICQLEKLLSLIILVPYVLVSCSQVETNTQVKESTIKPNWLKLEKDFALRGNDDEFLIHPFFDVYNEWDKESKINYIALMPEGSPFQYDLDMLSGSLYKVRNFCQTKDIWEKYKGKIERPNSIVGLVPRYLDSKNRPVKILVFTDQKNKFEYSVKKFHSSRIIGSILLEECSAFPCANKDRWNQSQLLIGIDSEDKKYSEVETLKDLKNEVDWDYTKAFIVNSNGSHRVGEKWFPAYRINSELNIVETKKYFFQNVSEINILDKMKFRDKCVALYKEMWRRTELIRASERMQQEEFHSFFKEFYRDNSKEYYECQKIVRPANINEDHERHWYFTFISAFTMLEREGLYYSCYEKGWSYNAKIDEGKYYIDQNKEIHRCRPRDFEKSFDRAINGMSLLKHQLNREFRYLEYDSALGGTHQKLFSWIVQDMKKIPCEKVDEDRDYFPQDVVWKNFKEDEDKTIH